VHVFEALRGVGRRRAAQRYYRNNLQKGIKATFTLVPKAPLLYLHGIRDGCMQGALAQRYPGELLPAGSRFELVERVGHFMQLEDPVRVNAMIAEWVGTPQGASAPPK
jgi:pimeloyl-ACP methyl ester carboxylesterase